MHGSTIIVISLKNDSRSLSLGIKSMHMKNSSWQPEVTALYRNNDNNE